MKSAVWIPHLIPEKMFLLLIVKLKRGLQWYSLSATSRKMAQMSNTTRGVQEDGLWEVCVHFVASQALEA